MRAIFGAIHVRIHTSHDLNLTSVLFCERLLMLCRRRKTETEKEKTKMEFCKSGYARIKNSIMINANKNAMNQGLRLH